MSCRLSAIIALKRYIFIILYVFLSWLSMDEINQHNFTLQQTALARWDIFQYKTIHIQPQMDGHMRKPTVYNQMWTKRHIHAHVHMYAWLCLINTYSRKDAQTSTHIYFSLMLILVLISAASHINLVVNGSLHPSATSCRCSPISYISPTSHICGLSWTPTVTSHVLLGKYEVVHKTSMNRRCWMTSACVDVRVRVCVCLPR